MAKPAVVIVQNGDVARWLEELLRRDATVRAVASGVEAVRLLERQPVAAVVCDLHIRGLSGLDVLRTCKRLRPGAEFIAIATRTSLSTAIEALREGAYDYVTKPVQPRILRAVVLRALSRSVVASSAHSCGASGGLEVLPGIAARSSGMRELASQVRRIAASDATVLVLGETGTGKERIARAIHAVSPRSRERMVAINCAAIPAELLEIELFGYARDAFTGAARERAGLFEEADQGSLFLEKIGEMRPSLQAQIARAIEERSIRRIGESKERSVNVRVIAATHHDVEAMVRKQSFREDLWHRLNVAVIRVPPLRDRKEDIEPLATQFLWEFADARPDRRTRGFTRAALEALLRYRWPGNVRQLRASIEYACNVSQATAVDVEQLPPEITCDWPPPLPERITRLNWQAAMDLRRYETARTYLQTLLSRCGGHVVEAAAHAGVERTSFYRLLRKHGIQPDSTEQARVPAQ